jgi:hypothetical protein
MAEHAPFLPGLSPVGGKPVHVAFDADVDSRQARPPPACARGWTAIAPEIWSPTLNPSATSCHGEVDTRF